MIQETSFLGMPLRTQGQRRLLVVLYYLLLVVLEAVGLARGSLNLGFLLPQLLTFGGLLGGIKMGGPVKPYTDGVASGPAVDRMQTLNLAGRKPFDDGTIFHALDERERMQRDFAHYRAYRILMLTLGIACVLYWLSLNWTFVWFSTRGPALAWFLLVYVISLPQSVLLWTEPEAPQELDEAATSQG